MSEESWLISHVKDKAELFIDGNMKHQDQRKFHSTVLTISRSSWGRKRKFSNLDAGDVKIKMFWHRSSSSRAVSYWSPHTSTYTKVRILVQHLRSKYFENIWPSTQWESSMSLCVDTDVFPRCFAVEDTSDWLKIWPMLQKWKATWGGGVG